MRPVRICALLLALAGSGRGADPAAQDLFNRVRAKVLESVRSVPRYTCVENITRTQYAPVPARPACRRSEARGPVLWRDRIRVDVALLDGREMFAWRGGRFEGADVSDLVPNGASGSGDFVSFLASVFGADAETIEYKGIADSLAVFDYVVPVSKSHYLYHSRGVERTAAYRGSFFVDPETATLKRLSIQTEPFVNDDNVCEVQDTLDYRTQEIGSGVFLLPDVAVMDVLFRDGEEAHNETRYSGCREYVGESTIRFDEEAGTTSVSPPLTSAQAPGTPSTPMPAGIKLKISLVEPVDRSAAAGDEVTGYVVRDVKVGKAVIAKAGDKVRGRILRMEEDLYPSPRWIVRLRFDSLETQGESRTMNLRSLANRPGEIFVFTARGDVVIDRKFQAEWETY